MRPSHFAAISISPAYSYALTTMWKLLGLAWPPSNSFAIQCSTLGKSPRFAQISMTVWKHRVVGCIPASTRPLRRASAPRALPFFAKALRALLKLARLADTPRSCISRKRRRQLADAPSRACALMTKLKLTVSGVKPRLRMRSKNVTALA